LAYRTTVYYTDKDWLKRVKTFAAFHNTTFNGLVRKLLDQYVEENATKALEEMNPNGHTPPGIFAERSIQAQKFRKMSKEELQSYSKILEKHVELFRSAKSRIDPLW